MRLDDWQQSRNIEDRRNSSMGGGRPSFGGGRKLGLGTIVLALAAWYFLGINPMSIIGGGDILSQMTGDSGYSAQYETSGTVGQEMTDAEGQFVSKVLGTTEAVWTKIFQQNGWGTYPKPKLVLYSGATRSGCGVGQAQMGPFYCPADQKVYLDLSFFRDTGRRLGVKGDFAQGYVIAHEIGHHVQNQLGILNQLEQAKRSNSRQANMISVLSELQADCFAGIWANALAQSGNVIESGDIEEAMTAAEAVGDDRIQKSQQGYAVPDSFTHGTSAQRVNWFTRGLKSGDVHQCDTLKS
ncbi:metalloprotease [Pelistega indica]|uniref:Metalloprotease n=1 Tax=Pelistega indica TaxID=1414851 RepID=V8G504_9BURK|nr:MULTISPECIES: neutral zinc metallopeptidase [Pelistega]ETD70772.1 metalloprotease [Pelistega indica]